jgi:hypothetical protein
MNMYDRQLMGHGPNLFQPVHVWVERLSDFLDSWTCVDSVVFGVQLLAKFTIWGSAGVPGCLLLCRLVRRCALIDQLFLFLWCKLGQDLSGIASGNGSEANQTFPV